MALTKISTAGLEDQSVTLDKLPHGTGSTDGKFLRANNGADPTFETVSTTPADGSITQAKLNFPVANRNLIINGAMQVAQRGTSSTSDGIHTVDRFHSKYSGTDEATTQQQADVASGTTPYSLGFRKSFKITNGNQTSGAGSSDSVYIRYKLEAQDIANSGWNYTSTSSFITLSFWVKSSVAQNFQGRLETQDGTKYNYAFETGALSADTWTKVTKTILGNSNLTFNNDNGNGVEIYFYGFIGTDSTNNSVTNDAWAAYAGGTRTKDATSTWYTTNDATFEITGVQLEVGSVATDFEHRSFAQELALCQRYYQVIAEGANHIIGSVFTVSSYIYCVVDLLVTMRATPTIEVSNFSNAFRAYGTGGGVNVNTLSVTAETRNNRIFIELAGDPGTVASLRCYDAKSKLEITAEL